MAIQPGTGYTFTTSSQGENLNIEKPWESISITRGKKILQFEVRATGAAGDNNAAIQIAKGAVNFDKSNMPEIWKEPLTSRRQIFMQKVAVGGSGITAHDGAIALGQTPWMENGGYYQLPGDGFYYVTICKPDIDGTLVDASELLTKNRPFVSIFKDSDTLNDVIFQETGPSQYVNRHNIQRMSGYDNDSTGYGYDFGACHTTWFNPVKWGYDCKIIATIDVTTSSITVGGETKTIKNLDIRQHVVGSIDINIPLQYLGSTLYDKEGEREADDPYNVSSDADFATITNNVLRTTLTEVTPLTTNFYTDMLGPDDWEETNYIFDEECTGESCSHPFHVTKQIVGESYTWKICTGMVNNIIPGNMSSAFELTNGYFYLSNAVSGEDYPYSVQIYSGSTIPADSETNSYIAIARIVDGEAEQLVSSSLWTERFKCGGDPAKYWFSNV